MTLGERGSAAQYFLLTSRVELSFLFSLKGFVSSESTVPEDENGFKPAPEHLSSKARAHGRLYFLMAVSLLPLCPFCSVSTASFHRLHNKLVGLSCGNW